MPAWLAALARVLYAQLFFVSACNKAFVDPIPRLAARLGEKGFPMPEVVAWLDLALEFGLAFMMLFGFLTRWAAWGMIAFCLVAGLLFHNFWAFPPAQMYGQTTQLLKNFAMIGGLLYIAHYGPGAWSIDGASERRR